MIWLDAQISPSLSEWINSEFDIPCFSLKDLGLRDEIDVVIFERAKKENVILITKDSDFVDLVAKYNAPPKIIYLTCGNTSNSRLKQIFVSKLKTAMLLLENEPLVEISDI